MQVVIFKETKIGREYLLLRRVADHGAFWQSVTGSLEEGESHEQAAVREIGEETGIVCTEADLIALGLTNSFEIAPQWLPKYAPGVSRNEEVCFALRVTPSEIRLDPMEHDSYMWVNFKRASEIVYWQSTRCALTAADQVLCALQISDEENCDGRN